jgi:hypothetical protein
MRLLRNQLSLSVMLVFAFAIQQGANRLLAQENVGEIAGVVSDPTGARVPNASVTARSLSRGVQLEVSTNADGAYSFPSLPIGEYTLTAGASGFKTLERPSVRVVSAVTSTIDFELQLGQSSESVQVLATASKVETSATTEGTTRVTEEINELPLLLNGGTRNAINFIKTLPGVAAPVSTGIETTTINGAPEGGVSLTIDGVMGSVAAHSQLRDDFSPPPEAIAEIRLNATDTAEYGWDSGVGVTLVTKSGTNQLHGDLFEYFRNKVLNARNWYAADADPSKQNEYGFTVGGPVFFPKIYNGKDKTFFFVVYSGFRYRTTPGGTVLTVPSAAMKEGDFSALLPGTQLYDGVLTTLPDPANPGDFTRTPFPGNIIPQSRVSKVSGFLQQSFPLPNRAGLALNWVGSGLPSPVNSDKGSFKIDQYLKGSRQRISFAYDNIHSSAINGGTYTGAISNGFLAANNTWTTRLSYFATLSPTAILSLRAALNRNGLNSSGTGPTAEAENAGAAAGFKGNFSTQMPQVVITDFATFGPPSSGFSDTTEYTTPANADLTWARGSHNLKFGAAWVSSNSVIHSCYGCSGTSVFLPFFTSRFFPTAGYGYADFLMGNPLYMSEATPAANRFQTQAWALYAQDSWHVNRKLTLNYGIRWDRFDMPHESYNRMSVVDLNLINHQAGGFIGSGPGDWPGAISFFGTGAGRNGLTAMAPPLNVWGPRFGLAYALTPKTVIRGSFGLSSSAMFGLLESGLALNGQPGYTWNPIIFFYHNQFGQLAGPCTPPYAYVQCPYEWDGGFPLKEPTLPNLDPTQGNTGSPPYWNPKGIKAGYSENINLGIEREVHGILLKGAYIGNLAHHLPTELTIGDMDPKYLSYGPLLDANFGDPAVVAAGIQPPFPGIQGQVWRGLLPTPQYAYITDLAAPIGFSLYHSFQATAQKRYGNGLSFLISYTISKQLTNYGSFSGNGVSTMAVQNSRFAYLNKALGPFDRPQNLTLSYVYELPFGPGKRFAKTANPALRKLVEGWRVAGIDIYTSGSPINIASSDFLDGFQGVWPLRVPGQPGALNGCGNIDPNSPARSLYLNPTAFVNPPPFHYGNTRTLPNIRNCPYFNEDFSIQKVVKLGEHLDLLFSGDFSNVLNRHTFTGLVTNISQGAAFGQFSGATAPRITQLHLKLEF